MLKRNDFDNILKRTVQNEWARILTSLTRFNYFDDFNAIDKRECCILSKIKEFEKDNIIISSTEGNKNLVHFILEGQASILMQVRSDRSLKSHIEDVDKKLAFKRSIMKRRCI